MNKKLVAFLGVFAVVAVVVLGAWAIDSSTGGTSATTRAMHKAANSFPVPAGATVAFPDYTINKPPTVTKGWVASGAIDDACDMWRDAYRGWIGSQNIGGVTGSDTPGQSCDYSGKKDGHTATLQLAVFGTNPQPQVTLTLTD